MFQFVYIQVVKIKINNLHLIKNLKLNKIKTYNKINNMLTYKINV